MPPGTLRINDMDFILNGPHVKYKSSSLPKTEKKQIQGKHWISNTENKKNLQVYCYSGFHLIVHTTAFCPPTQRLTCITGLRILPLKVVCKIWNNFLLEKTRLNAPHQKKKPLKTILVPAYRTLWLILHSQVLSPEQATHRSAHKQTDKKNTEKSR